MNNKKGFTLVEILVGLTIIAVLGATTIPSMMGFIEDRKAKECEIRRDEIIKMYEVVRRDGDTDVSVDDLKNFIKASWGDNLCPSGGTYRYPVAGREPKSGYLNVVIICGLHGSNNREGLYVAARTMQDIYLEIKKMTGLTTAQKQQMIIEEIKRLTGEDIVFPNPNNDYLSNESFREILMKSSGGAWEALDKNINDKVTSKELYVQAYVQPNGDVIIYANESNALKSWGLTTVYNPEDGYWYKPKAGVTTKYQNLGSFYEHGVNNWTTLKEDLAQNWERIEV